MKVGDIIKGNTTATANFEALARHKNLVLLTRAPIRTQLQATFYHSSVGIPMVQDVLTHVAKVGMSTGTGMTG